MKDGFLVGLQDGVIDGTDAGIMLGIDDGFCDGLCVGTKDGAVDTCNEHTLQTPPQTMPCYLAVLVMLEPS